MASEKKQHSNLFAAELIRESNTPPVIPGLAWTLCGACSLSPFIIRPQDSAVQKLTP